MFLYIPAILKLAVDKFPHTDKGIRYTSYPLVPHRMCDLAEKNNRKVKPDLYIKLRLDMEDHYEIKDHEK